MTIFNSNRFIFLLILSVNITFSQEEIIEESDTNNSRVENLATIIETSIYNSDTDSYLEKIDFNTFGKNIQIDSEKSSMGDYQKSLLKGFIKGLEALPQRIINNVESGDHYNFVSYRYDVVKKSYFILFRLFSVESGLNYHDYRVYEIDEELMLGDIYIYASGENISDTFKRLYINSLPKNKLAKLFSKNKLREFHKMVNGLLLYKKGNPQEAYNIFDSLKGDITKEKYFLIIKSQIANEINDTLYYQSLKDIVDIYPNDITLYLNHIDYYILQEDYENALNILDQLEFQTSDYFLAYMKGNLEVERGNYKKSSEYFKYFIENYPSFSEGVTSYLLSLTLEKKYPEAVIFLEDLLDNDYSKADLVSFIEELDELGENAFIDLAESDAYLKWKLK